MQFYAFIASALLGLASAAPIHHAPRDIMARNITVNAGNSSHTVATISTAPSTFISSASATRSDNDYYGLISSTMNTRAISKASMTTVASMSMIINPGTAYSSGVRTKSFGDANGWTSSLSLMSSFYSASASASATKSPVAISTPKISVSAVISSTTASSTPSISAVPSGYWRPHAIPSHWPQLNKSITAAPAVSTANLSTITEVPPTTISLPSAIVTSPMTPPVWSSLRGNYSVSWSTLVPTSHPATVTAADSFNQPRSSSSVLSSEFSSETQAPLWPNEAFLAPTATPTTGGSMSSQAIAVASASVTSVPTNTRNPINLYGDYPLLCIELRSGENASRPIPAEILNFLKEY